MKPPFLRAHFKNTRRPVGEFDPRNFIAHSGFLYQVVAVRLRQPRSESEIGYLLEAEDVDKRLITLGRLRDSSGREKSKYIIVEGLAKLR